MPKEDHYQKGMELFSEDKMELAIEALTKAVEEDPEYGDALHALAMSYYHMGELEKAIERGEQLKAAEPANVHAYTCLSMFYNAKGLIAKAEEMGATAAELGDR